MTDLDDDALMIARGRYSTIRAAHEDELKSLQILCGKLAAIPTQVLRRMQPENGEPQSVGDLIAAARQAVDALESSVGRVETLAKQRAELKPLAWLK